MSAAAPTGRDSADERSALLPDRLPAEAEAGERGSALRQHRDYNHDDGDNDDGQVDRMTTGSTVGYLGQVLRSRSAVLVQVSQRTALGSGEGLDTD